MADENPDSTQSDRLEQELMAAAPSEPSAASPVLRRSKTDRVIGGVAGGLGRFLGIDPVILRVAFVVLTLAGGSGVLLYIIGWIAIPEEKTGDPLGPSRQASAYRGRVLVGGALVLIGAYLLVQEYLPALRRYVWPVLLIAIGVGLLMRGRR